MDKQWASYDSYWPAGVMRRDRGHADDANEVFPRYCVLK